MKSSLSGLVEKLFLSASYFPVPPTGSDLVAKLLNFFMVVLRTPFQQMVVLDICVKCW